jgi:tetratricopeptide (TPR) repeat protein
MINAGEDALLKAIGLQTRAKCLGDIGKTKEALKDIDIIIDEGIPRYFNESGIYHLRGVFLQRLEMWNEAIKSYKDAVRLVPSNTSQVLLGIASCYAMLNDNIQAREYFKKALEVSPSDKLILYNTAVFESRTGNTKEAIRIFNVLIQLTPDNPYIYFGLGSSLLDLGMYSQAIVEFSKALSIAINSKSDLSDLDRAKTLINRGIAYEKAGDLRSACKDWGAAASLGREKAADSVRKYCNNLR